MGHLLIAFVLLAYFVGILLAVVATLKRTGSVRAASLAVFGVAWALQLWTIVQHGLAVGYFPLANRIEFLLVLAWGILTLYLIVSLRWNVAAAGLVLPPLAALMTVPALWLPGREAVVPFPGRQALFIVHTTVSTAGIAALCVAFAMSLMYLIQDRALKSKRVPTVLKRLPSLATCDRVGYLAVLAGFPLLTLGIVTGSVWNLETNGRIFTLGPKQIFPLLAWGLFALVLYARVARGSGGRNAAYLTIAGFALGIFTILGMTF